MRFSTKILFVLLAVTFLACDLHSGPADWPAMERKIQKKYPSARIMSRLEVVQKMESGRSVLFLDCRGSKEYDLSHLPGASSVTTEKRVAEVLAANPQALVVLYCSVGLRSAKLNQAYLEKNRKELRLFSLQGGIFDWANSGGEIENHDGSAKQVHPYSKSWTKFLNPELRAGI